ncbi:MAG TPA: hypothetical protein VEZ15_01220 [Acidimicrobiia bacterium]|nr:hypothetical protein [Acidimicrobiia bacterium]
MTVVEDHAGTAAEPRSARAAARGPRLSTVFTWVFAVGGLAVGIRPLHDNSFMWHLRTGRFILDHGIPRQDPFSYTAAGTKWVAQSWLAELVYGIVNRLTGAFGLRLLGAALGLVVGAMLFRVALRCANDRIRAGALALLAFATLLNVWSERPLMFGIVGMVLLVAIVELPESRLGRHAMIALPVLMWLWANTHGTFVIGFGYLALHLVGRSCEGCSLRRGRERVLFRASLIAAAVTLVNPYGIDLVLFPLRLMARGEVLRDVAEWQSPNFREPGGMLFGAFLVCTLVVLARKRPGVRDVLITVAFVVLGLYAIRNVGLTAIAILPVLARLVRNDAPRADDRSSMHRLMVIAAACALVLGIVHAAGEPDWSLGAYPVKAFKAVQQQGLEGRRLFTTDAWGGYVIATAWPAQKVFFDDRYDMYPIAVNRDYGTIANLEPGWARMLDRYDVEVVMSPRKSVLVQALADRQEWVRVYGDDVAVVYARRTIVAARTNA